YPERWTPPLQSIYKVNFAGSVFWDADACGVGVGVVIRDWKGEFVAALAKFLPELIDPSTACFFAVKCAIEFADECCFSHIVVEGEAPSTIIHELQSILEGPSPEPSTARSLILREAKGRMMQLSSCVFSAVKTSANVAAHKVAEYARNVVDEQVWLMEGPDFLIDILLA
ncbi:hypothetical protein M569_00324, partial [Genlisea aurea]